MLSCKTAAGTWDGDKYLVIHDFPSYLDCQNRVDREYQDSGGRTSNSVSRSLFKRAIFSKPSLFIY